MRYIIIRDVYGYEIICKGYNVLADTLKQAIKAKQRLIQQDKEESNANRN